VNHVTVFERPGLHEFLKKTSEFADLILFTAGLEGMFAGWLLPFFFHLSSHISQSVQPHNLTKPLQISPQVTQDL
jgi:RNA polymerase II subunit A small phosphatase-like protein